MLKPQGYATIVDPERPTIEFDTAQCCHCGCAIRVKPHTVSTVYLVFDRQQWQWEESPGASCYHCWKPVCLRCEALGVCTPLERQIAQWERSPASLSP